MSLHTLFCYAEVKFWNTVTQEYVFIIILAGVWLYQYYWDIFIDGVFIINQSATDASGLTSWFAIRKLWSRRTCGQRVIMWYKYLSRCLFALCCIWSNVIYICISLFLKMWFCQKILKCEETYSMLMLNSNSLYLNTQLFTMLTFLWIFQKCIDAYVSMYFCLIYYLYFVSSSFALQLIYDGLSYYIYCSKHLIKV